ncbi:MAG: hypothetical protein J6B53_00835 [Clostridia bacterium]|nr:hypothetical protein [Clostridia bacterium]
MKRLVVLLAVALVLVFAVSALAESTVVPTEEATETVKTESPKIEDMTSVDDGGSSDSSSSSSSSSSTTTRTTTTVAADPDATLNDDVSKYANNPKAIIADYGIDTFKEPVIFESVTTVGTNTNSLTISQQSLTEEDEVAVFVVYRLNGKLKRVQLNKFHWENGKIVCEVPANVAREIEGKQIRIDVIGEAK